jgi:hypothetical protein
MIYLTNGISNVITITPYEKSNQVQPYYTWQIIRKGTFDEVLFYQDDSSYAPWYWSSFTISVGLNDDPLQGEIIANPGEWTYNIWEMTTPSNLDITQSVGLVETGILIISGTSTSDTEYTGNDDSQIVYYKNI